MVCSTSPPASSCCVGCRLGVVQSPDVSPTRLTRSAAKGLKKDA